MSGKQMTGDIAYSEDTLRAFVALSIEDMMLVFKGDKALYANKAFLEFYDIGSLEEFETRNGEVGQFLMKHVDFKYEATLIKKLNEATLQCVKVVLPNPNGDKPVFLIRYAKVPEQDDFSVVSMTQITKYEELIYKENASFTIEADNIHLYEIFRKLQENSIEMDFHNFYKGINITNKAKVVEVHDDKVVFETTQVQVAAIKMSGKFIMRHEAFPHFVVCDTILSVDVKECKVYAKNFSYTPESPVQRKTTRIPLSQRDYASLSYNKKLLEVCKRLEIEDISVRSIRLVTDVMPAVINKSNALEVLLHLQLSDKALRIKAKGILVRYYEEGNLFHIVLKIQCAPDNHEILKKFVLNKQKSLIVEFKKELMASLKA